MVPLGSPGEFPNSPGSGKCTAPRGDKSCSQIPGHRSHTSVHPLRIRVEAGHPLHGFSFGGRTAAANGYVRMLPRRRQVHDTTLLTFRSLLPEGPPPPNKTQERWLRLSNLPPISIYKVTSLVKGWHWLRCREQRRGDQRSARRRRPVALRGMEQLHGCHGQEVHPRLRGDGQAGSCGGADALQAFRRGKQEL